MRWIEDVTQRFGTDILRMKGIIAMQDDDQRFVIQGVHMLIKGDHQRPWKPGETRESQLVFIGRDLPRDMLRQGFEACPAKLMQTKEMMALRRQSIESGERPGGGAVQGVNSALGSGHSALARRPRAARVPAAGKAGLCGGE